MDEPDYTPTVSREYAERLRRWHESAYEELRAGGEQTITYLGRTLVVPAGVFAPTPRRNSESSPTSQVVTARSLVPGWPG